MLSGNRCASCAVISRELRLRAARSPAPLPRGKLQRPAHPAAASSPPIAPCRRLRYRHCRGLPAAPAPHRQADVFSAAAFNAVLGAAWAAGGEPGGRGLLSARVGVVACFARGFFGMLRGRDALGAGCRGAAGGRGVAASGLLGAGAVEPWEICRAG